MKLVRVSAHYEAKLVMLKASVVGLASELATAMHPAARRAVQARVTAREDEIAEIGLDLARVRATAGL